MSNIFFFITSVIIARFYGPGSLFGQTRDVDADLGERSEIAIHLWEFSFDIHRLLARYVAAAVFPTDLDKTSFGTDAGNEATASDVSMPIACIPANFRSSLAVRDAAESTVGTRTLSTLAEAAFARASASASKFARA